MKIAISTDSTCDLTETVISQYGITVVPLSVLMDGKVYRDGVEMRPERIFAHVAGGGELCSTSAVNVAEYTAVFERLKKEYDVIIHINIGSGLSSCYQNARIAAEDIPGVFVVDSMNLSTGTGYLVVMAARMAAAGHSAEEIVRSLNALRERMDVSFVIDKLDYIRKGGRCSAAAAFGANLLNIRPSITVKSGVLLIDRKYRGPFKQCVKKYIDERITAAGALCDPELIFITHAACTDEVVELARATVEGYGIFKEILVTEAGCTISSHCGPNTLGVLFARKGE